MTERPTYSLVLPIFNEEAVLPLLLPRLDMILDQFDGLAEVIFVDDGSRDLSSFILEQKARTDPRFKYLALSRNFGHQVAVTAGLDRAQGDAVIVMDADLQDPPELVHAMIAKWKEGFEVVCAQRRSRPSESVFKRASANAFYRVISRLASVEMPRDVGDFRLVDRKVVAAFRAMPERDRFVRGMFAWVGFKQTVVGFDRAGRAAGHSKYPLLKMARLAVNGIISFSEAPLRLALWLGMAVSTLAIVYGCVVIVQRLFDPHLVPGWTSTMVVVAFLGGANMLMTGIMGLYVGRIYAEVKRRPLYVTDRAVGFDVGEAAWTARAAPAVPSPGEPARVELRPARTAG